MPRPKKEGGPEPKKRSRTGCWPCKQRKVKCDERRPKCINCEKQGEVCDYSIRLNWEGRGKNKAQGLSGSGQIDFSANIMTFGGQEGSKVTESLSRPSSSHGSFQPPTNTSSPAQSGNDSQSGPLFFEPSGAVTNSYSQKSPTVPMIDPVLVASGISGDSIQDGMYGNFNSQSEYQHTQSYERYHSSATSVQFPQISRLRQMQPQDISGSLSDSNSSAGTVPTRLTAQGLSDSDIDTPISTPPFNGNGRDDLIGGHMDDQRPLKKKRYQLNQDSNVPYDLSMPPPPPQIGYGNFNPDLQNSFSGSFVPLSAVSTPLTPASSNDDDYKSKMSPKAIQESLDLRRLSVNSLLSGPPGIPYQNLPRSGPRSNTEAQDWFVEYQDVYQDTITYGVDRGFKDLDIGKNDDVNAISGASPVAMRDHLELVLDDNGEFSPIEFGFGSNLELENGGYYDKPVPICIPKALEPLPNILRENNMNLLYFHHFINHTANCLIPHNCSSNPFRSILPQMAVRDENLLKLLLAYSANHRARLLRQPDPSIRIAQWVQGIFGNLREALDGPQESLTNSNLATAIMLASLEIISPKAFGVEVPWQNHLDVARQMIAARGGPQSVKSASRGDMVLSFLWSWFAYLDVLGSLSGGKTNAPSSSWILDYSIEDENDYNIDCILGFTSRCIRILAQIAELSRICDNERIGPDTEIRPDWEPSEEIVDRATKLEAALADSRNHPAKPCTHMQSTGEAAYHWDSIEMAATNEAFHWAGHVQLHRRILGKWSEDPDVQQGVRQIFGALYKVRRGSSAEGCLLFPMFTAGCDTKDLKQRMDILERIQGVEKSGMTQVHKARTLMERVWETGKPWETLVAGEFVG